MSLHDDLSDLESRSYERTEDDEEDAFVPFTNLRACTGCFNQVDRGVKCWKCGKRLCGKPPCARQANGDTFCASCWPDAIEAAVEAAESDRKAYRNALVLIAAGEPCPREYAARVLDGHDVPEPTILQQLAASLLMAEWRKTA